MKKTNDSKTHHRLSRLRAALTSIAMLANKAQTHMAATLRSKSRRIAIQLVPFFLAIPIANAQQAADWMSGKSGIGWRFRADDKTQIANWNVNTLVSQVKSIPGVTYVVFNLSDAAHGDAYIAPHSVLTAITPAATPNNNRDLFMEMATAFKAEGIKVIAYVATQGPAMLKHGAEAAFDAVEVSPGVFYSQAMENWKNYVYSVYNIADFANEREMYKRAFGEVILNEYAARYGTLIDGWWFDNGHLENFDAELVYSIAKLHNPNCAVGTSSNLSVNSDFLNGHPEPLVQYPANHLINLPMLTAIEATPDGFLYKGTQPNLGHMFMALGTAWNSGPIVWSLDQAADWMTRCLNAGGAWTWNVDLTDNSSIIRADSATFLTDLNAKRADNLASNLAAPTFSQATYNGGNAQFGVAYTGSLAGSATDADGNALTYAIAPGGPDWLKVSTDGTFSGTPYDTRNLGMNRFTLVVADGKGLIDLAELEIYVRDGSGSDKSYSRVSFDNLRPNLSAGSIKGLGISDPNVSITLAADGNDAVMSLSITNQNLDGICGDNDTLSWDVRVKGYSGGSYTLNGNNSAAQLGTSVPVGMIDNEFGVSGTDLRFVDDRESIQYSVENVVLTTDAIATAQFDGFDGLWATTGSYILGIGPSGLESKTLAANGELSLSPATVLTLTSTGKERLRDLDGDFTIYPNNAPYFAASSIQVNGEEGIAYSDTLTNLSATATDPDGDPLTYSKAAGPAWLSVASDGTLSGTPGAADVGHNTFTIQVNDPWNATDNLIVKVSVAPSTPPAAPSGVSALANISKVDLDWSDNSESNLGSYTVYRSTTSGNGYTAIASGLTSSDYSDTSVTNHTTYYYVVSASNIHNKESAMSNEVSAYPGYVASVANSEVAVLGSVSGAFTSMNASNNTYQTITEVVNGGTSALEHKWVFNVASAELATFYVEAFRSANTEGDDMVFAYSTDGVNYIDMVTVTKTADNDTAQYYALPSGTSGTVHVRLKDANRVGGNTQLDSISIDQLLIIAEESTVAPSIAAAPWPANTATNVEVNALLRWTAGHQSGSHDVYFGTSTSPAFQGNQSGTSFNPGVLANNTTYYWAVDEVNNSGTTPGNLWSFTTAAAAAAPTPSFVASGGISSGTGTITPALPSGRASGDILLLFVETANQAVSISNPNGGTWAEVSGSPQGTGTAAGSSSTRLTVFWSRYNGTQGNPTVSDSGDHQTARTIAIRGAAASGNPWNVTAGGIESTSDTSASIPGVTTTVPNTLVVVAVAGSLPDANGTANFSGWSNSNLTDLTERTDDTRNSGNGGALGIATGKKATAGATGNTAATHASSAVKGMISIAIKP
ncbi:MAG: putative Ig domain-containing protein [Luteolibacter sp.]